MKMNDKFRGAVLLIQKEIKWQESIFKRTTKDKKLQKALRDYI